MLNISFQLVNRNKFSKRWSHNFVTTFWSQFAVFRAQRLSFRAKLSTFWICLEKKLCSVTFKQSYKLYFLVLWHLLIHSRFEATTVLIVLLTPKSPKAMSDFCVKIVIQNGYRYGRRPGWEKLPQHLS